MSKLYYTIGEVASLLNENCSTLRFWEKEFQWLRPVKNSKGDRRYVENDIALLRRIQHFTRDAGYTIEGAREQLRNELRSAKQRTQNNTPCSNETLENITKKLHQLREALVILSEQL